LESQRVKFLTKGYLRGWLNFQYNNSYSRLREDIILYTLEQEHYTEILETRLHMDTALVSGAGNKTRGMLSGLDDSYNLLLGMKLPELATKTTIKTNTAAITKESIQEWKAILDAAKNQQAENK
jgi:hypothetical protein